MNVREFLTYFQSFYGPKGLYPFDFEYTNRQVELCIQLRGDNFEGDSIDREAIRDILMVANNKVGGIAGGL